MPLREGSVVLAGMLDAARQLLVDPARDPAGQPHDQRSGWDDGAVGDDGAGRPDASAAGHPPAEEDRAHPDQAIGLDPAAVQDGPMPHTDPGADQAGQVAVDVNHRQVLDVALFADLDGGQVPPQHRAVPDARLAPKDHVPDERGIWSNVRSWMAPHMLTPDHAGSRFA